MSKIPKRVMLPLIESRWRKDLDRKGLLATYLLPELCAPTDEAEAFLGILAPYTKQNLKQFYDCFSKVRASFDIIATNCNAKALGQSRTQNELVTKNGKKGNAASHYSLWSNSKIGFQNLELTSARTVDEIVDYSCRPNRIKRGEMDWKGKEYRDTNYCIRKKRSNHWNSQLADDNLSGVSIDLWETGLQF